jgi:hypothetical protein
VSLDERLRAVPVPDEDGARRRAEAVALAAFAAREPAPPRRFRLALPARVGAARRRIPAPALATGCAVLLALLALTPPGQAVINSVRDTLGQVQVRPAPRPALDRLPTAGTLLVESAEGPWVVRTDGSKRLLGPYREATWSPHALFVAVTRRSGLLAVEPGGRVHWSLARPRVSRPRWAPSGFRVAYLSGPTVRVVAGDGTGDRELAASLPGVAAEWRPGPGRLTAIGGQKGLLGTNVLAVATPEHRVRLLDVDQQRTLWTSGPVGRPRMLSWSGGGTRLLVTGDRELQVLDGVSGVVVRRVALPAGARATSAAFGPGGGGIAVVRRRPGVSELVLLGRGRPRLLFAGAGQLGGVTWSPDGRWLLVGWPTADEFLFVRTDGPPRVQAVLRVAQDFHPRAVAATAAPVPAGWCCSR